MIDFVGTSIQTRMILIIGTNGTGKTTLANQLINKIDVPRKLILTQQMDEWRQYPHNLLAKPSDVTFKGINWHLVIKTKEVLKRLIHLKNGLIVFDDSRRYLTAQTGQEELNLYISRRQNAVHIIMIAHGFTQVPPQAFTFCTDIILFATRDNIDSTRKNTVQNYEHLIEAQTEVNEKAKENWHYYKHLKY